MAEPAVSKGEFARLIKVSPGRVSQMITEGKIGPDAMVGEGRNARILVDTARRQIADRTDIGQRFGNGLDTQLDLRAAETPAASEPAAPRAVVAPPPSDPIADAIKRERLRAVRMANERAAEDRLAEQGRYIRADQAQAAMNKLVASVLSTFEGGLVDMAGVIAAAHSLPVRDVLHELRTAFREVRTKAAEAAHRDLAGMSRTVADEIADATDPAQGEA